VDLNFEAAEKANGTWLFLTLRLKDSIRSSGIMSCLTGARLASSLLGPGCIPSNSFLLANPREAYVYWAIFSRVNASLISRRSEALCFSTSCINLRFSCFKSLKSSSSLLCQGYSTNTWNARAEVAIAKFVMENLRAINMLLVCA